MIGAFDSGGLPATGNDWMEHNREWSFVGLPQRARAEAPGRPCMLARDCIVYINILMY